MNYPIIVSSSVTVEEIAFPPVVVSMDQEHPYYFIIKSMMELMNTLYKVMGLQIYFIETGSD